MLLGTYTPKLDDKGRVILPAKFRTDLGDGVVVTRGTAEDLGAFHELYVHTAERDHFTPRPLRYFQTMFEALGAEHPDRIQLWLGHHEGDLVAEDVHEVSVELTGPVESTGSLWDPIPITAPTYVSQPLAPRTVRTIDLSAPVASGSVVPVTADRPDDFGRVDAGRTDAGAAPERRRASGE